MRKRLGCLSRGGITAAVITLAVLLLAGLLWGGRLFSPGPLNAEAGAEPLGGVRAHADTGGRCSACHPAPWSGESLSDRCLACHTSVAAQLDDPASLHGALDVGRDALPCQTCHGEHGGPAASLTVIDADSFPHDAVGYSLAGHREMPDGEVFACADCHGDDLSEFDITECVECHRTFDSAYVDAHVAAFGRACLACHDGVDRYGAAFDHADVFALDGAHATAPCAGCHPGARAPAELRAAPEACYACHEADDAHDGGLGTDCAHCHVPAAWDEVDFDHETTAFPLEGAHRDVDCADCHVDGEFAGTPLACVACHDEPAYHTGLLGTDCAACHTAAGWTPALFDRAHRFPFDHGEEGVQACRTCHPDVVAAYTCYECHEHEPAEIAEEHRDEGITDFDNCVDCHPTGREDEAEGGDD